MIASPVPFRRVAPLVGVVTALAAPVPARAQFGAIETLARQVSDLSFYYGRGGSSTNGSLDRSTFGLTSFGVELLFEVARVPSPEAQSRLAGAGPQSRRVLREVEVRRTSDGGVDTVYHYDVVRSSRGFTDEDILWTLELGIGYGQLQGLELRDPALDLNAMIRTLPSVTLYVSYEPLGTYLGLRTGFLRTYALQVIDSAGAIIPGRAEAFMMGALVGYAFAIHPSYLFIEAGYTARSFPSVEWSAPGALPSGVPRALDASGWGLSVGIQFPVN